MRKKNILFYSHQANLAGAPLSLAALASGLSKSYNALFVTPHKGPVLDKVKCRKKVIGNFLKTIKLVHLIREHNIDIVHANTIMAQPAVYAAKMTGVKLVWHIREDLAMFPRKLPGKIMASADKVVIISDSMQKYFSGNKKVVRVYNGLPELKIKKSKRKKVPVILFAGTMEKRKGVRELLEALETLKERGENFSAELYGKPLPTEQGYYKKLLKFVRRHKLADKVRFMGVTKEIQKAIGSADIVTIPSLAEPFGRVAVEAMVLKKPVIASKCGGLAEIVVNNSTGLLVKPGDPGAIFGALMKLVPKPKLGIKFGRNGYQRYKKMFTLKKHVQEIEKIYRSI